MSMVCCCSLAGTNACLTCNVARRQTLTTPQPVVIAPIVVRNYDYVEVVRCRDCKHWQKQEYGVVEVSICTRGGDILEMDSNDFCSRGERKDEI